MSLIGNIVSGIMGGHAAGQAANAQVGAAQEAAGTVTSAATQGNTGIANATAAGQQGVLAAGSAAGAGAMGAAATGSANVTGGAGYAQGQLNPYSAAGAGAAGQLAAGLAPGGTLARTFTAANMEQNDPGYQFRLQQGEQALQRSLQAAGSGGGGGAMKQLMDYGQNLASAEYGNAFNRFMTNQQANVGNLQNLANAGQAAATTQGNQQIQANEFNANLNQGAAQYAGNAGMQTNEYSAGLGYQSASQQAQNSNAAALFAGKTQLAAGDARAQGILGKQNSYNGLISGIGGALDLGASAIGAGGGATGGLKAIFGF